MTTNTPNSVAAQPRVFISYKRHADPDVPVVEKVIESMADHCQVYIDKHMRIGTEWGGWIKESIRDSDYFIVFMTESSLQSQMVAHEIHLASSFAKEQNGKPKILPVKLGQQVDLNDVGYNLGAILQPIQWAEWNNHADTPELINKLLAAIHGTALPLSSKSLNTRPLTASQALLPAPALSGQSINWKDGNAARDALFYVERAADQVALEAIGQEGGETMTIKGPRQIGKSSLLARVLRKADELGRRKVWLDFTRFDEKDFADPNVFYKRFCQRLTQELQDDDDDDLDCLEDKVEKYWERPDSNVFICSRYVDRQILRPLSRTDKSSLVLALDNVDKLAGSPLSADFFGMLRSWHNERAFTPSWEHLYLILAISTEPFQLIDNMHTSPFNVGQLVELDDFTPEQVADLNLKHGSPFSPSELKQLIELLGGQPFLIRRALYLVASRKSTVAGLFASAGEGRGPFSDFLRPYLVHLHGNKDLERGLRDIIHEGDCANEPIAYRLRGMGLIHKAGRREWMRCKLYHNFFKENL